MAIKLSGSITRKLPIVGIEYSSQSFAAGMEIEVNTADPGAVQTQLAGLYDSLSRAIDTQIAAANGNGNPATSRAQPTSTRSPGRTGNGYANGNNRLPAAHNNGNGRVMATQAQQRAIFAICKSQGIDMAAVLAEFNVTDPKDLHVKDASQLIDRLKSGNNTAA